ncbi:MAG: SH3 domain-containing protein, partial [SAR324 cluster bacterium]|nr:SH3 domain-containing protein [SAR324 cluster bacterium]
MRNSLRITLALGFALLPTALLHAESGSDFLHPHPATVLPSHLNVREEPGVRHRILSTLRRGAVVLYGEKSLQRGWVRIAAPSHEVQGWVLLRLLQPLPREELPSIKVSTYAVVRSASLNLRTGPGTQHDILRPLSRGTHLTLSNTAQDGWQKVRTSEDEQGWISTKYLHVYEPQALPVSVSRSQLAQYTSPLEASILEYMNETYAKKQVSRKDQLFMVVQDLTSGTLLVAIRPRRRVKAASLIK